MPSIGTWVVGVTLKFKSNTSAEITEINKALKALRDGEIARTQKAFGLLGEQMLTLGKKMDSSGKVERNVFNSLSKGLTKLTDQTKVAAEGVTSYATAFDAVKMAQAETFDTIRANLGETASQVKSASKTIAAAQAEAFRSIRVNLGQTAANTRAATTAMNSYTAAIRRAAGAAGAAGGLGAPRGGVPGGAPPGGVPGGAPPGGVPPGPGGGFGNFFFGGGHHVSNFASGLLMPSAFAGGMNAYIVGMALRGGVADALGNSAAFQNAFVGAANVMGATSPAQREKFYSAVMQTSNRTGVSPIETMQSMLDIGRLTTGTMPFSQSVSLLQPLTEYARILQVTRGLNPKKTINAAIEQIHLFQQYNPGAMIPLLNQVLAMGEMIPNDPERTVTQLKQFAPALINLGVSNQQIMALYTWVARAGLGTGRGGTGLRELGLAVLKPAALTSSLQKIKNQQEEQMFGPRGWKQFYTPAGHGHAANFDIIRMIQSIGSYARAHPGPETMSMIYNIFGRTGGTVAQLAANPATSRVLSETSLAMQRPTLTLDNQFKATMKNYSSQAQRLRSAWESIEIETAGKLLPSIAHVMDAMASGLHDLQAHMHRHPEFMKGISDWISSVGSGISSFTKFIKNNPDFVHGLGNFAKIMGVLAGIKIGGSILGLLGNLTFAPAIASFFRALMLAGGISLASVSALPVAIGTVIAAIGMAVLFPKKFEHLRHTVSSALSKLADSIVGSVIHFIHMIRNGIQDAFRLKTPQEEALDNQTMKTEDQRKYRMWSAIGTAARDVLWTPDKAKRDFDNTGIGKYLTRKINQETDGVGWGKSLDAGARNVPHVKHIAPHAKQSAQAHASHIQLTFNGPVYADKSHFTKMVADAMREITKNPMSTLGTSFSPTRTHPNIPQFLAVGAA